MEGLVAELKVWVPLAVGLCSLIGICITIFLLGWRIPSKAEMNRADDNLQQQINHGADLTLAVTKEIREDMRQMRSEILTLAEKIDSNSQAIRADMGTLSDKLNDKIDASTRAIYEKIDAEARDLRTEIRELNQDHKAHLAYHNEKAQS